MTTRQSVVPPNLPLAPKEYDSRYVEQLNNVQRLFYNSVSNRLNLPYPYGQFYTTGDVTLSASTINKGQPITFANTSASYNTYLGTIQSKIYVAETGIYNVQFSAQCDVTSGGRQTFYFWIRQNGADVPSTSGKVAVSATTPTMAAWNYILPLQQGDYIQLVWGCSDTHATLVYENAVTTGFIRPALPAVILTISWVSPYNPSVST